MCKAEHCVIDGPVHPHREGHPRPVVRSRGLLGSENLYPTRIDPNYFLPDVHTFLKKKDDPDLRQTR